MVKEPEAGIVTAYQTSPPKNDAQPGAGGVESVADSFVASTGLSAKTPPLVNAIAPVQSSFKGGKAFYTVGIA